MNHALVTEFSIKKQGHKELLNCTLGNFSSINNITNIAWDIKVNMLPNPFTNIKFESFLKIC